MSDHEFEKQVRQKLNNLKITPSPEAWENIEERLRARRRRLPLLWLPLLLAGIAAGGYFFLENGKDRHTQTVAATQASKPLDENQPSRKSNTLPLNHETATPATDLHPGRLPVNAGASSAPKSAKQSPVAKDDSGQRSEKDHLNNRVGAGSPKKLTGHDTGKDMYRRVRENDKMKKESPANGINDEPLPAVNEPERVEHQKPSPVPVQQSAEPAEKQMASSQKEATLAGPVAQKTAAAPVPKHADSRWSYAITLHTGASAISKNGLGLEKSVLASDVYPQSNFAAVVVNYAPVYKPSVTSPGLTFSAGAEVKRELSTRFSLSAGLNYTQMNTHLKAGQQLNNDPTAFGLRGYLLSNAAVVRNENKEYRNKYHFIEIPVSLHTKLNNSTKLPIYWDIGFVVSRLLSSASVHFDGTTGIYYKNDSLVSRTQAGFMTGFSLVLFNKTPHPLWIGPSIRSNISPVLKNDPSDSRHFMTLGLDLRFFLKR